MLVEKTVDLKPRGLRWSNVRLTTRKTLKKEIDIEKNFEFHPYLYTPRGVSIVQSYKEDGSMVKLIPRDKIRKKVCYLLIIVAPALLPSKLETEGSVTSYNP